VFRQLEFQNHVIATMNEWLGILVKKKRNADKIQLLAEENPQLDFQVPDFTADAWKTLLNKGRLPIGRQGIQFSPRVDGCGHPVPNAVLKVPTGGGKTWIAINALSQIFGRFLNQNYGFVLWIVPNEAIYTQTLKHLKDQQHQYRQTLNQTAAGRVKIMEKTNRLTIQDVQSNLCVMILMLQSANRQTKETLKMFQDRGDVHGFFPPEGNLKAHSEAINRINNLDSYNHLVPFVKSSLGNVLRIIKPVIILDEGHRAISDLAFHTLYDFNPSLVLELTATPKDVLERRGKNPRSGRYANVLVDVTGRDLDREGMVKMPLNLQSSQGDNWNIALNAGLQKLNELHYASVNFRAETGRYIRPIMLVQVERTGTDQRDSGFIHAEDVKDWLVLAGLKEEEIAIKTAERNDLKQPENEDLLSEMSRVRVIITKQALQEGWDCSFAYILCALAASSNKNSLTQLVGRILRQPHAIKTGVDQLDECYVITHRSSTAAAVKTIKNGLENDGLGDLAINLLHDDSQIIKNIPRKISRRSDFEETKIYLPRVMLVKNGETRDLDYETDILADIDWHGFNPDEFAMNIPTNVQSSTSQFQRIRIGQEDEETIVDEAVEKPPDYLLFQPELAVQQISDIIGNPFVGREIIGLLLRQLKERGFTDDMLGTMGVLIIQEFHKSLEIVQNERAEKLFKSGVLNGEIQFRLRADGRNWEMPKKIKTNESTHSRQLIRYDGLPLQKSLFSTIYEEDLNQDERDVAVYLDSESTLTWWHRNVARSQYGIQGWKGSKIYPDFIFALREDGKANRIMVLETKGDHLDNLDTEYKRKMLNLLSENFSWNNHIPAGELSLITKDGNIVQCELVLMSEWQTKLPKMLMNAD